MAVFKCKMCGGSLDISDGISVATCEYCGTKQTIPKSRDEVVSNLFNRANNLRLKCEFDKAEQVYEKILDIDNSDAEAHWGVVLCKYGIEYVEDPKTYSRIPTCHRTLYETVLTDVDYLSAIENADAEQKDLYIAEAKIIDELQKNILTIVNSEEPFDVFICYKESDTDGRRTPDSVLATELYHELIREGFKVFFSRITLEDKLGQEYEPYIFAALNSAKVMVVLGTKPEYFNAVWVKNEWSRYLALIKNGVRKMLIPAYKDMDPYDLPEEFSHLQAQDMSKLGFMQDLIHCIKKFKGIPVSAHSNYDSISKSENNHQISKKGNITKRIITCIIAVSLSLITALVIINIPSYKYRYKFMLAAVEETVTFGNYEQDNNLTNGKEDIEWIVLEKKHNKLLLISKFVLEGKEYYNYNTDLNEMKWNTSPIRKWLNNDFYNTAFNSEEKNIVLKTEISDISTKDKVFILNRSEAIKYFSSNSERLCGMSEFACTTTEGFGASYTRSFWWLRDGYCVTVDGNISGEYGTVLKYGIRPVIWVDSSII